VDIACLPAHCEPSGCLDMRRVVCPPRAVAARELRKGLPQEFSRCWQYTVDEPRFRTDSALQELINEAGVRYLKALKRRLQASKLRAQQKPARQRRGGSRNVCLGISVMWVVRHFWVYSLDP